MTLTRNQSQQHCDQTNQGDRPRSPGRRGRPRRLHPRQPVSSRQTPPLECSVTATDTGRTRQHYIIIVTITDVTTIYRVFGRLYGTIARNVIENEDKNQKIKIKKTTTKYLDGRVAHVTRSLWVCGACANAIVLRLRTGTVGVNVVCAFSTVADVVLTLKQQRRRRQSERTASVRSAQAGRYWREASTGGKTSTPPLTDGDEKKRDRRTEHTRSHVIICTIVYILVIY